MVRQKVRQMKIWKKSSPWKKSNPWGKSISEMCDKRKIHRVMAAFVMILLTVMVPLRVEAAIPEPTDNFYVNDYAGVLSDDTMNYIIEENLVLEEKSGAQIVVVTVDYSDGEDFGDYALQLFNEWDIGSASKNNGLLLVLFIGDDNYYALQGRGIETVITGGDIQQILDEVLEPYFARQQYDEGVRATFREFYDILDTYYNSNPVQQEAAGSAPARESGNQTDNKTSNEPVRGPEQRNASGTISNIFGSLIFLGILFLIIISVLSSRSRRRRRYTTYDPYYPGGGYRGWWGRRGPRHYHRTPPPPPPPGRGFGMGGPGPAPRPGNNWGTPAGTAGGGNAGSGGSGRQGSTGGGSLWGGGGSSRGGGAGRSTSAGSSTSAGRSTSASRSSSPGRSSSAGRSSSPGRSSSAGRSMGGGGSSRGGGGGRKK